MGKNLLLLLLTLTLLLSPSAFALSSSSNHLQTNTGESNAPVIEDYYMNGLSRITVKTKVADKSQIRRAFSDYFKVNDITLDVHDTGITVSTKNQVMFLTPTYVSTDIAFSWTTDETLKNAVEDAAGILELIGISYMETPVHACFYTLEGGSYRKPILPNERSSGNNTYISVCLSPEFRGIPLAQEPISDRGKYDGKSTAITDIYNIDFVFDSSGSFIAACFPLLEIKDEQELTAEYIPYQDIMSKAYSQMMALIHYTETNPAFKSSLLQRWEANTIDDLLQKYEFRVTRIRSVWLDDYQGHLRPGWSAKVEVYLKETNEALMFITGKYSYPEIFCFGYDAIDGRSNSSYYK